jgi:hypothetical protein
LIVKRYSGQGSGLLFLPEESLPGSYLLWLWHDIANTVHDIVGAVSEASEVLSVGYTANVFLPQTLCAFG